MEMKQTYKLIMSDGSYLFYPNSIDYGLIEGELIHEAVTEREYLALTQARDNPPENHEITINPDLTFDYIFVVPPPVCPVAEAEARQKEMQEDLAWATIQREYHLTGDVKRMVISMEDLSKFSIACRDHVQIVDGVLTIIGERPIRPATPRVE